MRLHSDSNLLKDTLVIVLAGGKGERLYPLTRDRTKGAVPFGGMYRLIDFTLSNVLHSGLRRICVLPQYKFASLKRHLSHGWNFLRPELRESLDVIPPQQRINEEWYRGTADAVYQNLYTLEQEAPARVLILSSDHIYRMDYLPLLECHVRHGAEMTIACKEVDLREARRFGIAGTSEEGRITRFVEKPAQPEKLATNSECALGSMGIYVFETDSLIKHLRTDAVQTDSQHDFGRDVIPKMVAKKRAVYAYNVQEGQEEFYWRDIGVIDAYWQASMELLSTEAPFQLDDATWPLLTYQPSATPAFLGRSETGCSKIADSLICPGVHLCDAHIEKSILSPGVAVDSRAHVVESVLMDGVNVGRGAHIDHAIIDKDVVVPANCRINPDSVECFRDISVSPAGIVVIPKGWGIGANCWSCVA